MLTLANGTYFSNKALTSIKQTSLKKSKSILGILIERALEGQSSKKEEKLLSNFVKDQFKYEWDSETMGNKDQLQKHVYSKVTKNIKIKTQKRWLQKIAAVFIIGLISVYGVNKFYIKDNIVNKNLMAISTSETMKTIHLEDGSIMHLSPKSVISYPKIFNKIKREVTIIEGNVFFNVAKDADRPFIIKSGDIKTRVVGTSFNIEQTKNSFNINVATGKVSVSSKNSNVELVANESAVYSSKNKLLIKNKTKNNITTNWFNDSFEFKNKTIKQVFSLLKYKYKIGFNKSVNPDVLNSKITISIKKEDDLNQIIEKINYVSNLNFTIKNKQINLH